MTFPAKISDWAQPLQSMPDPSSWLPMETNALEVSLKLSWKSREYYKLDYMG